MDMTSLQYAFPTPNGKRKGGKPTRSLSSASTASLSGLTSIGSLSNSTHSRTTPAVFDVFKFISNSLDTTSSADKTGVPTFDQTWLNVGRNLGKGNFCRAEEINSVSLPVVLPQNSAAENLFRHIVASQSILESGRPKYAIKSLRKLTKRSLKKTRKGLRDLSNESTILADLQHPHIIKLHGTSTAGQFSVNNFLLLDCLYDTLDKRLGTWRKEHRRRNSLVGKVVDRASGKKDGIRLKFIERLQDAYSISAGLVHIHENEIIHRDLKPENIGYDAANNIKIFDFGFARQLTDEEMNEDGTYHLSLCVGSLLYMAPEVGLRKPYNTGCDVYSFAILLWKMIGLERPFPSVNTHKEFVKRVFHDHERPPLGLKWSQPIKDLLTNSWSGDIQSRLTIFEVHEQLHSILHNLHGGDCGDDMGF